jgi:hypothetical protein
MDKMLVVNLQTYSCKAILANNGLIFDQYRHAMILGYIGSIL